MKGLRVLPQVFKIATEIIKPVVLGKEHSNYLIVLPYSKTVSLETVKLDFFAPINSEVVEFSQARAMTVEIT